MSYYKKDIRGKMLDNNLTRDNHYVNASLISHQLPLARILLENSLFRTTFQTSKSWPASKLIVSSANLFAVSSSIKQLLLFAA